MMVFLRKSVWAILIAGIFAGSVFASDPRAVAQPKLVTEPLLDLEAELAGQATPRVKSAVIKTDKPQPVVEAKPDPAPKPVVVKETLPWSYSGDTGPANWGSLSPKYSLCDSGKNQSPVNFVDSKLVGTTRLKGLDVNYRDAVLRIVNTGTRIRVDYPRGSYIKIGTQRFEMLHYHFNTPSEHQRNGFNFPMEMQIVHKNSAGNLAIIAVIFQEGKDNKYLEKMISHLPTKPNQQKRHRGVMVNPAKLFPRNRTFFKYNGSLTNPPCTEGVSWIVFKHPVEASYEQIQKIKGIMGENNRPVQKINARTLLKSYADQDTHRGMLEFF